MKVAVFLVLVLVSSFSIRHSSFSAESAHVAPATFLRTYCIDCHGEKKQRGDLRQDGFCSLAQLDTTGQNIETSVLI